MAPAPADLSDRERTSSAAARRRGAGGPVRPRARRPRSARCSSAGPTPAARPCCSRRSGSRPRWRRAGSCRRSAPGSRLPVFRRFYADIGDRQIDRGEPVHLQRPRRACCGGCSTRRTRPPSSCSTRSGAGPIRPKARRSRRRRWCRSPTRGAHARDHAPRRAQGPGEPHAGRGERVAPVRRRDAHADLPVPQRRARPLLRPRHRAPARRRRRRSWPTPRRGCPDAERSLDAAARRGGGAAARARAPRRRRWRSATIELDALEARLGVAGRSARRRGRRSSSAGRRTPSGRAGSRRRAYLLEARQLVEQALGAARAAADDAAAREARRMVEEGIREQGEELERAERTEPRRAGGARTRHRGRRPGAAREPAAAGEVLELRARRKARRRHGRDEDGGGPPTRRIRTASGKTVRRADRPRRRRRLEPPPASLEIDLRGMTGDEAEQATVAAVDAAVLAEQPYLRIIHGMGTGVVRERVRRVVSRRPADRAVTASRRAIRAAPASPSWSSPREHDPRRDRRAGARQRRPGRASSASRSSSSAPARTTAAPVRSTAAPTATSPSFPRRAATTASSATRAATSSPGS